MWRAVVFLILAGCSVGMGGGKKIGVDPQWVGLDLVGRDRHVLAFSTELLQQIGKDQGLKISLVQTNWDHLLPDLEKGELAAILSPMQPYAFNRDQYDFSEVYLPLGPVLVVPVDSKVKGLDGLSNREVAVIAGSDAIQIVEKHPAIIIREYGLVPDALSAILDGHVDGALVARLAAIGYCSDIYQGKLKIVTPPLNRSGLRLISLHGKEESLINAFDQGLSHLEKSGKYDTLAQKWSL